MGVIAGPVRVIGRPRAWTSLLFLVSRLPLGFLYFGVPAALGAAGVLLVPAAGIGVLVLLLALAATWALAAFERHLGRLWLGVELGPRSPATEPGATWRTRLRAFLGNPVIWKSLAYLLLQLPLGTLTFLLFAGGSIAAVACMSAPLAYLVGVVAPQPLDFGPLTFAGRLGIALGGLGLGLLTLHLAVPAGRAYGVLIELLLGMGRTDQQLAEARSEAAAEHARAEESEQKRSELIVNMSHELRTPAASIRGHAEALLDPHGQATEQERRRYLEVLAQEAARVGALTDDLLSIAGTEAEAVRLDLRAVDAGEVVGRVVAAMRPIAERDREITLTTDVAEGVPAALADQDRLDQVLMNLVRNAITHTPDGGIVSVQVSEAAPDRVALAVEDTGAGIDQADLDRIFERFYRTDASRSRRSGGFGLGLAIARELVEAMGGSLEVESQTGTGSRFTVLLAKAGAQAGQAGEEGGWR
jgi:two-component system, OmpR family, phosphate regulon sensor histidine kinase PhoR